MGCIVLLVEHHLLRHDSSDDAEIIYQTRLISLFQALECSRATQDAFPASNEVVPEGIDARSERGGRIRTIDEVRHERLRCGRRSELVKFRRGVYT
jgi:hypothetical protein